MVINPNFDQNLTFVIFTEAPRGRRWFPLAAAEWCVGAAVAGRISVCHLRAIEWDPTHGETWTEVERKVHPSSPGDKEKTSSTGMRRGIRNTTLNTEDKQLLKDIKVCILSTSCWALHVHWSGGSGVELQSKPFLCRSRATSCDGLPASCLPNTKKVSFDVCAAWFLVMFYF